MAGQRAVPQHPQPEPQATSCAVIGFGAASQRGRAFLIVARGGN
jgi:hypothetical protein